MVVIGLVFFLSVNVSAWTAPVGSSPSYYQNLYPQYQQTSVYVHPLFNDPAYVSPGYTVPVYQPVSQPSYQQPVYAQPVYVQPVVYQTQTVATGVSIPKNKITVGNPVGPADKDYVKIIKATDQYVIHKGKVKTHTHGIDFDFDIDFSNPFKKAKKFADKVEDKFEDKWDDVDDYCDDHWFC